MNRVKSVYIALTLSLVSSVCLLSGSADAKKTTLTVYDRQVALTKEIAKGEQSKELTAKEATDLRSKLADIEKRKTKMETKNGGKLSYEDTNKIEKDLNDVSLKIQKKKLEKRVQ
jgi:hypothetical protein